MELYPLNLARLHHAQAGQFIVRLLNNVKNHNLDLNKDAVVMDYIKSLTAQSETFKIALQQMQAKKETEDIAHLDEQRDYKIVTLEAQINVAKYSSEKEEQNAYKAAKLIMKKYKSIAALNYEEETIQLENLLAEWAKPENQQIVQVLQLKLHIDKLRSAADAFTQKFDSRSTVTMLKEVFDTKALRNVMMDNYKEFADDIYQAKLNARISKLSQIELMCDLLIGYSYFKLEKYDKATSIYHR